MIPAGAPLLDDGDGIGPDHLAESLLHGFEQRAAVRLADVFDQVHQHLRIGAAAKRVSVLHECVFQHAVVLDDTVVYQGYPFRFGVVGMGVCVVREPRAWPSAYGYSDGSAEVLAFEKVFQVGDLAFAFENVEGARCIDQRDACAVVSPVFEAVQTLHQNRSGVTPGDYPTIPHICFFDFCSG